MRVHLGPRLIARFRPDLLENFSEYCDLQSVADYIYHCNAQQPRYSLASASLLISFYTAFFWPCCGIGLIHFLARWHRRPDWRSPGF